MRSDRPSALTTPAVTVQSKPNGLPTATAIWPTRSADESPNATGVRSGACSRTTARSVSGSSPDQVAGQLAPVEQRDVIRLAPLTTWLLVST